MPPCTLATRINHPSQRAAAKSHPHEKGWLYPHKTHFTPAWSPIAFRSVYNKHCCAALATVSGVILADGAPSRCCHDECAMAVGRDNHYTTNLCVDLIGLFFFTPYEVLFWITNCSSVQILLNTKSITQQPLLLTIAGYYYCNIKF